MDHEQGKILSRCNASGVVFIALFLHIALILSILEKVFFNFYTNLGISVGKGSILFFVILFMVLTFLYYNEKRIDKIMDKYSDKTTYPTIECLKVLLIILIPLIAIIIILSNLPNSK